MHPYSDTGGDRRIAAFGSGPDYIEVMFRDGLVRRYTYADAGRMNVEMMKWRAVTGNSLMSFIMCRLGPPLPSGKTVGDE